jgi:succinate dehydrogenase / fumarate reductase, cytochrome b subunit
MRAKASPPDRNSEYPPQTLLHRRAVALRTGTPNTVIRGKYMAQRRARPLSPHLTIYKWGPHMAISIINRATGVAMAIAGLIGLVWWLVAAAGGKEAYETFMTWAKWWPGYVVAIGLTWSFFQHMLNGLRHFVLDAGAGYELNTNRRWSIAIFVAAPALTALVWGYVFYGDKLHG